MHELYIAQCILTSAREALPNNILPESVRKLQVQVGQLDAVDSENLIFLFEAIKSSQGMSGAELMLETIEVRCRCEVCAHEFGMDIPLFLCPECGSGQVKVLQGRGIILTRIIAEES